MRTGKTTVCDWESPRSLREESGSESLVKASSGLRSPSSCPSSLSEDSGGPSSSPFSMREIAT